MSIWYARAIAAFLVALWVKLDRAECDSGPGSALLEHGMMFVGFAMLAIAEIESP